MDALRALRPLDTLGSLWARETGRTGGPGDWCTGGSFGAWRAWRALWATFTSRPSDALVALRAGRAGDTLLARFASRTGRAFGADRTRGARRAGLAVEHSGRRSGHGRYGAEADDLAAHRLDVDGESLDRRLAADHVALH